MPDFDLLLRNGYVVDGTGAPGYVTDIGICDDKIVSMGRHTGSTAEQVMDVSGLVVAPGFIDLHTHYDAQLFWDPYCSISGWHGITTVVIGNCGFGFAPVQPAQRDRAMSTMERVEAIPKRSMQAGLPWDWIGFPAFLDSVDRTKKAVNVLAYLPVGPLLIDVLGFDEAKAGRMPSDAEHEKMQQVLDQALDAGACGWSAQRLVPGGPATVQRDFDGTPMVTDVMHDETLLLLADVLGRRNEGFTELTMVSGDPKRDAKHYEEIATRSGRPVLYNVLLPFDDRPHVHRNALKWLKRCHQQGIRVYGQAQTTDAGFTFTFEDWNLFDDSEPWREATTGSPEEKLRKLADPERRDALRRNRPVTVTEPIENITILAPRSALTERYANLRVGEAAALQGKDPVDAFLDIVVEDQLKTLFYANPTNTSRVHIKELLDDPAVLLGVSDGGAHTKFLTAGRYGTETIASYVRDEKLLTLEAAHYRLSGLPAWCAGLRDRGIIRPGAAADIVVYDYDQLSVLPTETVTDVPGGEWRRVQRSRGYRAVIVNGKPTIVEDQPLGLHSGRLLRHCSS